MARSWSERKLTQQLDMFRLPWFISLIRHDRKRTETHELKTYGDCRRMGFYHLKNDDTIVRVSIGAREFNAKGKIVRVRDAGEITRRDLDKETPGAIGKPSGAPGVLANRKESP